MIDNHIPLSLNDPITNPPKRRERTVLKKRAHRGNGINRALRRATPLKTGSRSELLKKPQYRLLQIRVRSRGPSPLYIEERHRALGRDATFSWSRALTHPPRCNRTRHRGRHLDFVGAAILVSWGPPSWIGSRGGRHLGSDFVTSLTLKWGLYYSWVWRGLGSMNKGPNATIRLVRRQNHTGTTVSWTTVQREKSSHAYKLSSNVQTACSTDSLNNCPKHSILRFSSFALKIYL